jgi:transcriptional regulator with XRE-family HTH domain
MKKEDSMGDGKNLKKYLDEKGTNVRKIAKATGISATTLYSIIQKDSNIRFDFALRLANELQIDVNEICSASPFSGTIKEEDLSYTSRRFERSIRRKPCKDLFKKFYVPVDVSFR